LPWLHVESNADRYQQFVVIISRDRHSAVVLSRPPHLSSAGSLSSDISMQYQLTPYQGCLSSRNLYNRQQDLCWPQDDVNLRHGGVLGLINHSQGLARVRVTPQK